MSDPSEKRFEPRFPVSLRVNYKLFGQDVQAQTEDLSFEGMFLLTTHFLPLNRVLPFVLRGPEGEEIRVIGRVAHLLPEADAKRRGRNPGMGIQFLSLEQTDAHKLRAFVARAPRERPTGQLRRQREADLLVVCHQPAYLEQLCQALGRAGFRVRTAGDGLSGLAECLKRPPALLLSAVDLPQMDGWALLRMVRTRSSLVHLPFVLLTALASEAERLRGFRSGIDDYITQPYDLDELAYRLDRVLARYEQNRQLGISTKTLAGEIEHVSVEHLLRFLEEERQSGTLLLLRDGERATLFLSEGRVVQCRIVEPDVTGAAKVYYALGFAQGRFEFAPHDVPEADEIAMTVPDLLMEYHRKRSRPA